MAYSCSDFTDDILNALGIEVPEDLREYPQAQAELALTEIARLRQHVEARLVMSMAHVRELRDALTDMLNEAGA